MNEIKCSAWKKRRKEAAAAKKHDPKCCGNNNTKRKKRLSLRFKQLEARVVRVFAPAHTLHFAHFMN